VRAFFGRVERSFGDEATRKNLKKKEEGYRDEDEEESQDQGLILGPPEIGASPVPENTGLHGGISF
jgi:hypothetical protein